MMKIQALPHIFTAFNIEVILLSGMFGTLLIPPELTSITPWNNLSIYLFIRASFWIFGLCVLPGAYFLRLTRFGKDLSKIEMIVIGIHLSIVLVGMTTLILYYIAGNVFHIDLVLFAIILLLSCAYWFGKDKTPVKKVIHLSKWRILLLGAISISILLAFSIQANLRYLMPGDAWVSLTPTVELTSQRDVFAAFSYAEYPLMFGFILAGLAASSGLPIVNTYVILFPLISLNILSFLALSQAVFRLDEKASIIASIIYGFGGGLGWLYQTFFFNGGEDFWRLSLLTQDIYFSPPFWNSIQFYYKSLALTLAFASMIAFYASIRVKNVKRRITTLFISSLFLLFSFFIHMLEPLIFGPIILFMAYLHQTGLRRHFSLGFFFITTALIGYLVDTISYGYYSDLTIIKVELFLESVNEDILLIYALMAIGIIAFFGLFRRSLCQRLRNLNIHHIHLSPSIFLFFGVLFGVFIGIYIREPRFPITLQSWDIYSAFPLELYVTRYGFVGVLAVVGIAVTRLKDKKFLTAYAWAIIAIVLGSLWWGSRLNAYLFPVLALFGGVGVMSILRKAGFFLNRNSTEDLSKFSRKYKAILKPVAATAIIAILSLSFTSVIYGANYYLGIDPPTSDDAASVLSWINQKTPENSVFIVPDIYAFTKGVMTIADRKIFNYADLPILKNSESLIEGIEVILENRIEYVVRVEGLSSGSSIEELILPYSKLVFQAGDIKVYKLPEWKPSSYKNDVAILLRDLVGPMDRENFGWVDSSFVNNWTYVNLNASTNGRIFTFRWDYSADEKKEPAMKKNILPIDTERYPFIILRYRNLGVTTSAEEGEISQIITLVNKTGYPKGFVQNIKIPIQRDSDFHILTAKLPENQNIAEIGIWMRNNLRLDGTVILQIDYIGLASVESISENYTLQFLSIMIPSLWPTDYNIFSNLSEIGKANILVSVYDETIFDTIQGESSINTYFFLNKTAAIPQFGDGWRLLSQGLISGYLEGKRIIILGIESNRLTEEENLTEVSKSIFEKIQT